MFCHAGEMGKAQYVFDVAITRGITLDLFTYTLMINSYCRENHLREACDLLNDMKKRGIEPDAVTYTVFIDGCSKIKDTLAFWRDMKEGCGCRA
jgi:pentatricopeptide repeat protein